MTMGIAPIKSLHNIITQQMQSLLRHNELRTQDRHHCQTSAVKKRERAVSQVTALRYLLKAAELRNSDVLQHAPLAVVALCLGERAAGLGRGETADSG